MVVDRRAHYKSANGAAETRVWVILGVDLVLQAVHPEPSMFVAVLETALEYRYALQLLSLVKDSPEQTGRQLSVVCYELTRFRIDRWVGVTTYRCHHESGLLEHHFAGDVTNQLIRKVRSLDHVRGHVVFKIDS